MKWLTQSAVCNRCNALVMIPVLDSGEEIVLDLRPEALDMYKADRYIVDSSTDPVSARPATPAEPPGLRHRPHAETCGAAPAT